MKKLIGILFFPWLCTQLLFAQHLEKLGRLLEENRMAEIEQLLPEALKNYPDEPLVLYLRALLEPDGKKAVRYYEDLFEKHRDSEYADAALLKISMYYFARGLYENSYKYFKFLTRRYPDSPWADDAAFLAIECLRAQDQIDVARSELADFVINYPKSSYRDIVDKEPGANQPKEDLLQLNTNLLSSLQKESIDFYSVQVGAFRKKDNADRQSEDLRKMGYDSFSKKEKRGNEILYIVYVGKFDDKTGAIKFGEVFYDRYGIPYRIVQLTE